jgi:hypothetical protein
MSRIIKQEFGRLTIALKENRGGSKYLLSLYNKEFYKEILFIDEKILIVEGIFNKQNNMHGHPRKPANWYQ